MKMLGSFISVMALAVFLSNSTLAQNSTSLDPATQARVEQSIDNICTQLNLKDAQKTQIKPILQDELQQLKAVSDDASLSAEQKQAKVQALDQGAKAQMNGVLSREQQDRWASIKGAALEYSK